MESMMSEPTIHIEIDHEADLTYLQLSPGPVTRTIEFTPEINVDLDEFGMVVGIESLSSADLFDVSLLTRLVERYHVTSEVAGLLPAAMQAIQDFIRQTYPVVPASERGILYPSNMAQLTPCP
jgi:uncharacterized protein YuzE